MKRMISLVMLLILFSFTLSADDIEQIVVKGNRKVSSDTVLFYMKSKVKGIYSPELLREDFMSLWETGFFADIRIDSEPLDGGRKVIVTLVENPMIAKVTYKTGRKIKEKDITEKLGQENVSLAPFTYYSPVKKKRVESLIHGLMQEKGYNDGKTEIKVVEAGDQVELTVSVDHGSKTKIGTVDFPGLDKKKVSPGYLRAGMKNNKQHGLVSMITSKDVYNQEKISEDLEEVSLRLKAKGYLEAKVGQPEFGWVQKHAFLGKKRKMMKISIPVELGPRYILDEVKIVGNKIIRTDFLKAYVKMKPGKPFNMKKRNKAIEEIQKFYSSIGYFYCRITPEENLDPVKKTADLSLNITENELVYVGKINFIGNTFTKDQVIRREWLLQEGHRLRVPAIMDSIRRMKQLGLVNVDKEPQFKQNPDDVQVIDMDVEVQELNRQMINFSTGYSGYDGFFVSLGYSTKNFMGMGESLTLSTQVGSRSQNYRVAFTEPYIFNLNATAGFDVFKTSYRLPGLYTRDGTGFNISSSWRFWKFWGASLVYSLEDVEMRDVNEDLEYTNYYYYYYYQEGKRTISALNPVIYYSTVDSPIFPSSGSKILFSYRYSGGFLGGDVDLHKFKVEGVQFFPLWKRKHTLGFHLVYNGMTSFGDQYIPNYERFYMGGEQSIRGFDAYDIGPKDTSGYTFGGTKSILFQAEYQIPVTKEFSFILFYDVGNAYDLGKAIDFKDLYQSMGLEVKVYIPLLGVPIRLIFSYNPRLRDVEEKHFVFRFGIGPSFY